MKSTDNVISKLYVAVINKKKSVLMAFAISNADFSEVLEHIQDHNDSIRKSDMVLISDGLTAKQYTDFTDYAHKKFDHHNITVTDVQDLWVSYAKEHGIGRPEDTAYANTDGTNQYQSAKPDQDTNSASASSKQPSQDTGSTKPQTAKDDSHPIHDDVFVPYDLNVSGIYINNALGITNNRLDEISGALQDIIKDEASKGKASPEKGANVAAILSRASKVAKTHAELLYIGYLAGANIESMRDEIPRSGSSGNLDSLKKLVDMLSDLHDLKKKSGSTDHFNFSASEAQKN